MFTINQIREAHAKVKSGADFPAYVQDLIKLGVISYQTFVADGRTIFHGSNDFKARSDGKYPALEVAHQSNKAKFKNDLKAHQQGKTSYMEFCLACAGSGIEKWVVNMDKMTCTYYNKVSEEIWVEAIPVP